MFLWIASIIGAIVAWELFDMGLEWWGRVDGREEWYGWLKWGREDTAAGGVYKWSFRLGPLQIFRM